MIRLVNISAEDEVTTGGYCFAWFDTVTEKFLEYCGTQVWETWNEFEQDWIEDVSHTPPIERFKTLFYGGRDK